MRAPPVSEALWTPALKCSNATVTQNANYMRGQYHAFTRCPTELWYWEWQSKLVSDDFVYLEVGCNKASDSVMNLRAFTADKRVDIDKWLEETQFDDSFACDFDRERWQDIQNITETNVLKYRHFCIEAAVENAKPVQAAAKKLGYDRLGLSMYHAAVSSSSDPPSIRFPVIPPGAESTGIDTNHSKYTEFHDVKVVTVDEFIVENHIERLHVLKIDTEGNDPLVLLGAINTLVQLKPSYLQFENHQVGRWMNWQLKDVIDLLDNLSYDCFWPTKSGTLIKMTSCWSREYNMKVGWSNVACHHRDDPLLAQIMNTHLLSEMFDR